MDKKRKIALVVGVLYILGTAFGILSVALTRHLENADGYLKAVVDNEIAFKGGILSILLMGLSLAFIPILLFPILKKISERGAMICLVFRSALETVGYVVTVLAYLGISLLAQKSVQSATDSAVLYQMSDTLKEVARNPVIIIFFSVYALTLYILFYKGRLVPRWISVFGVVAIVLHFSTALLVLFDVQTDFSFTNTLMNFPIFIQEMMMAIWLIVRGFNDESTKNNVREVT